MEQRPLFAHIIAFLLIYGVTLLAAGGALSVLSAQVQAAEYYVAPTGHDSASGAQATPWKTLAKASTATGPGDTVYIMTGTYEEKLAPTASGTPGSPITFAAAPGHTPIIDGKNLKLDQWEDGLVLIVNKQHITISGLTVKNAGPNLNNCGILVMDSEAITIRSNTIYNTVSSGIGIWSSKTVIIKENDIELACNDGEQECLTVADTCDFQVSGNHIHNGGPGSHGGEGLDVKDGSCNGNVFSNHIHHINRIGLYIDAWDKHTYNIEAYKNRIHDCKDSGIVLCSEAGGLLEEITVYNNYSYNNTYDGITIGNWGEDVPYRPIKNITIINNTFYNNGSTEWGGCFSIDNPDVDTLIFRNNICSENKHFQILIETTVKNLSVDHNLIHDFRGVEGETYGTASVTGAPLFKDPSAGDFRLKAGSPAIDKGSLDGMPPDDFKGTPRPQ